MDKSFSLLDLAIIFLRQKKRIAVHFLAVTAAAVAISYLIPKNYKATTLFLPPFNEASAGFSGLGLGLGLNIGRDLAFTPQQVETLFGSRRIHEATIRRFDLIRLYKTETLPNKTEQAIKRLRQRTKLKLASEEGFTQKSAVYYALSVVDKDRRRAADMANFMVEEAGRAMNALSQGQYRYSEAFIGGRLDSVENRKKAVHKELADFQKKYKVYSPQLKDQVLASIDVYAELQKQKIVAEMDRDLLLFDRQKNSREARFAQKKVDELAGKMEDIERGGKPEVLPGLDYSVDIAYRYLDLVQEAEVLTKLELLLRQQYEEARIRSARSAPTVRVVDRAVPPEWKNSPKKALIVLLIVGIYMIGLLVFILASHGVAGASAETKAKLGRFREALGLRRG